MFSKTCQYAIRACIYIQYLSCEGKKVDVKTIAEKIDAPEAFIAKVLQTLVRKEIVSSRKGKNGGFFLNDVQQNVTLKNIVEEIDGKGIYSACVIGISQCSDENPCPVHFEYAKIRSKLLDLLTNTSLIGLCNDMDKKDLILSR